MNSWIEILLIVLAISFLSSLFICTASAEDTPYLQLERRIEIGNSQTDTDFAVNQDLIAITGNASLFLANHKLEKLLPQNSLASLKSVYIDSANIIWAIDTNSNELIKLRASDGRIKRLSASLMSMSMPTDINKYSDSVFIWERDRGRYVYLNEKGDLISSGYHKQASQCIAKGRTSQVCINTDQNGLQLYQDHKLIVQYSSPEVYSRYSDIAISSAGYIWVSDVAGGKLLGFTEQLQPLLAAELVSSELKNPNRISTIGDSIWVLDPTQQAIIEFNIRLASSAFEHQLLAEEYLALGKVQAAWQQVMLTEALTKPTDELGLLKGKILYTLKQYKQAIIELEAISRNIEGRSFWLGNAYFYLRQYDQAADSYQAVDTRLARYNLGIVYIEQGQYYQAQQIFLSLLVEQPDDHSSRLAIIKAYQYSQEYSMVLKYSQPLLIHEKLGRQARYYTGLAMYKTGQLESAIIYLQRASKEGPYYTKALKMLVDIYSQRGELILADKARKKLQDIKTYKQGLEPLPIKDSL